MALTMWAMLSPEDLISSIAETIACISADPFSTSTRAWFPSTFAFSAFSAVRLVMLAISSSLRGRALPKGFFAFGEVGLAGEVRPAPRGQERLKEAAKLGFTVALVPKANAPKKPIAGLEVYAVERVEEALQRLRALE